MRTMLPAHEVLTDEQLHLVRKRSNLYGAWLVLHVWAVIIGAAALVAWSPNLATILLSTILIGSRQLGLVVLMHEGAHGGLNENAGINHKLAQWLCAWPMFADVDVYRPYHLQHHAKTLTEQDPDIVLTGHYPISRESLKRKLFRDISGQSGLAQRKFQLQNALGEKTLPLGVRIKRFFDELGGAIAANLVLFLLCASFGFGWLYLVCWILPLLTWYQVVLRIRNIAEHAVVRGGEDPFGTARTTITSLLERIFIAPYWVNYHLEHHLLIYVPCYRLPLLHRFLCENGYRSRMQLTQGYMSVLREVTSLDIDDTTPGGRRALGTFGQGYQ